MPQGGTDGWAGCGRERGCSYAEGARALEGGVAVTECSSPAGFQGKSASPVLEVRLDTRAHVSRVRLLGSVQTRSGCEAEVGLCWHLDGPGAWSLRLVTCQLGVCREGETVEDGGWWSPVLRWLAVGCRLGAGPAVARSVGFGQGAFGDVEAVH